MQTLQTIIPGLESLTLSPSDRPVRTYQSAIPTGEGWMVNSLDSSLKPCESFAQFDPDFAFLKTSEKHLFETSTAFSGSFPKAGSMLNGSLYQRQAWVRRSCVKGCSLLPTPKAQERPGLVSRKPGQTLHLSAAVLGGDKTRILNPQFVRWLMGYPDGWLDNN